MVHTILYNHSQPIKMREQNFFNCIASHIPCLIHCTYFQQVSQAKISCVHSLLRGTFLFTFPSARSIGWAQCTCIHYGWSSWGGRPVTVRWVSTIRATVRLSNVNGFLLAVDQYCVIALRLLMMPRDKNTTSCPLLTCSRSSPRFTYVTCFIWHIPFSFDPSFMVL